MGLVLPSAGLRLVPACGPSCPLVADSSPFCHPPLGDFQVEIAFYKRSYPGPAGKEMAKKKKKKKEEGNISGYLFLCSCDATDRNLGGTCAYLVPLHVHQVMSLQELASGGGGRGGGRGVPPGRGGSLESGLAGISQGGGHPQGYWALAPSAGPRW